ncbi:MAG: DUF3168 domain-containing protein [Brevundimonas sp.]|uniref:DUF3168 domain-containing protein n=1 Tax=Brevundimonas sp. TaxID=1871086 RepID=UPI001219CC67|nr:DUF3168 domain-containing protein [Brevundimonas sp.]RZJ16409.1 MAG: DUF3168 domain-containing protein [Brevundimonas sp.]
MTDHEGALARALIAHLKGDGALQALLGNPVRIWDQPPEEATFPHLLVGRNESRPLAADGGGVEHRLTLTCASQFAGMEEARAVAAAVRARLADARITADGVRTVSLGVVFADAFRSPDMKRAWAVMRVRAVTEEI